MIKKLVNKYFGTNKHIKINNIEIDVNEFVRPKSHPEQHGKDTKYVLIPRSDLIRLIALNYSKSVKTALSVERLDLTRREQVVKRKRHYNLLSSAYSALLQQYGDHYITKEEVELAEELKQTKLKQERKN